MPEYEALGIPFERIGRRIDRLTEAVAVIKGCFGEGPFSFAGEHYTITNHEGLPKPVQRPRPPLFIGGGGKRLLTLAGREADIVGVAPRTLASASSRDVVRSDPRSITVAATEEKLGWIRDAAGDRFDDLEINTYPRPGRRRSSRTTRGRTVRTCWTGSAAGPGSGSHWTSSSSRRTCSSGR